ncbi:MAG: hypothetical protein WD771_12145 [Gemmatimonadaceae bacterium]
MAGAFAAFATAQMDWIARQLAAGKLDVVALAARALRISALQVGAHAVAGACEGVELAGGGRDATGVRAGVAGLQRALAAARPWLEGLAAG